MDEIFNWSEYFEWLVNKVNGYSEDRVDYLPVLLFLSKCEYTWVNELDGNRATDGKLLRVQFADESGCYCEDEDLDIPCSVLEVLVGLSIHVDSRITGVPGEEHADIWFWEWLKNLGIDERCTGAGYDGMYLEQQVKAWMNNDITTRGDGGPFPLRHTAGNQKSKDMWMQCMAYINERIRFW